MDRRSDEEKLEKFRVQFGHLVQNFEKEYGISSYLNRAPVITQPRKTENAKLLVSRYDLLKKLPKNARVVEVGVDKGNFSIEINEKCSPNELILIDLDLSRIDEDNEKNTVDRLAHHHAPHL